MTEVEMAEEYRKAKSECKAKITKVIEAWSAREETIHDVSFKDGAEFGYNKAKEELKKENAELKSFIKDLIYENRNICFQFSNTTCLFNSDYRNRAEELMGEKL